MGRLRAYVARAASWAADRLSGGGAVAATAAPAPNPSAGYRAADALSRVMRGWLASTGSADEHVRHDLAALRDYSGDAYRNMPVAGSALRTAVTNIVGPGLVMQSRIDRDYLGLSDDEADAWQDNTEREFRLWCRTAGIDGMDFGMLQGLALLSAFMNGDVFGLLPLRRRPLFDTPYTLTVQLVEGHQVCTPDDRLGDERLVAGIEVSRDGVPIACHVMTRHPGGLGVERRWRRVPLRGRRSGRRNVVHLFYPERVGQKRGFPYLAGVLPALKQLSRLSEAELMAAVVTSFFTVLIKSETGEELAGLDPATDGAAPAGMPLADNEAALGSGNMVDLAPGEDAIIVDPKRPNALFEPFFKAIVEQIGAAIEQPAEVLMKKFDSSYSAARAALLMAWKFYLTRREWLVAMFCQPIYEEWLREAVIRGRVRAPGYLDDPARRMAWSRARWNGPVMGQIDPLKEVLASERLVKNDFSTRADETIRLTGGDFDANIARRRREEAARRDAGLREEQ